MKRPLTGVFAIALLVCPVLAREKLAGCPERFKGNVKTVRTKSETFTKASGEWVKDGEAVETVEEISDPLKSIEADKEDVDEDSELIEDPIVTKQGEGYDAGYGSSLDYYGFYKIDEEDNILEAVHYSPKRELAGKDLYLYSPNGNEIERTSYAADGTIRLKSTNTYEYDQLGNWVKRVEVTGSFDSKLPAEMEVTERVIIYR